MKDPQIEEPKIRDIEWASGPLQRSNNIKFFEKAWKKKQKEWRQKDWERRKSSTLATKVNLAHTIEPLQKKKNQGCSNRASRDTSQIKCYNC